MNMQNKNTIETNQNDLGLNPYQKFQEGTTEIVSTATTRRFKYLEGHPRQYRFDAKEGVFNINGAEKAGTYPYFSADCLADFSPTIF